MNALIKHDNKQDDRQPLEIQFLLNLKNVFDQYLHTRHTVTSQTVVD